jgi:hypothetical protein
LARKEFKVLKVLKDRLVQVVLEEIKDLADLFLQFLLILQAELRAVSLTKQLPALLDLFLSVQLDIFYKVTELQQPG